MSNTNTFAFDLDGVWADFNTHYIPLVVRQTGKNLFPYHESSRTYPHMWNYDKDAGYTPEELKAVWKYISDHETFWEFLPLDHKLQGALPRIDLLAKQHQVYFITNRPSKTAQHQSQRWIRRNLGIEMPNVIVTPKKGAACSAVGAHFYIDDNWENCAHHEYPNNCRVYLLNDSFNQEGCIAMDNKTIITDDVGLLPDNRPKYKRVDSIQEALDDFHSA